MRKNWYVLGLDLGLPHEYTALAVVQIPTVPPDAPPSQRRPSFVLGHLERFPLGTSYREIWETTCDVLQSLPSQPPGHVLVVDKTAVGNEVVQMVEGLWKKDFGLFLPVTITLGHGVVRQKGVGWCVPKKELVGALLALFQRRRLILPRGLMHRDLLITELINFKMNVPVVRPEQMLETWRDGQHDDLVFAAALAAWVGKLGLPSLNAPPPRPRIAKPERGWRVDYK